MTISTECKEFLTPRDVYSSTLLAHRGFINSEPFMSDSYERTFERTFERTYEHSYQPNYESNVSSDKTIGTISSTTDQFIICNENSLEPKQNETQFEDVSDGNRSHGKLQKQRRRSKSTRVSKGARRDREPSRLPWKKILNLFDKNKAIKRYVRSHIVHSVPHSSALKNILSFDYRDYLKTKTRTAKHKKTSQVSVVFRDEFVRVVQCNSIKCKKQKHKYCVSRAQLNPGPVVTQGNNPNNVIELLQSL